MAEGIQAHCLFLPLLTLHTSFLTTPVNKMSIQTETWCIPLYQQVVMGMRTWRKDEAARRGVEYNSINTLSFIIMVVMFKRLVTFVQVLDNICHVFANSCTAGQYKYKNLGAKLKVHMTKVLSISVLRNTQHHHTVPSRWFRNVLLAALAAPLVTPATIYSLQWALLFTRQMHYSMKIQIFWYVSVVTLFYLIPLGLLCLAMYQNILLIFLISLLCSYF